MKFYLLLALFGSVSCAFKDHAKRLYIGVALQAGLLDSDASYKKIAVDNYNSLTPEYELKFDTTEPNQGDFRFTEGDKLISFAKSNGMSVRGHTLVWHRAIPGWANSLQGDALKNAMTNHISTVVNHFKGSIVIWDVVNEVLNDDGSFRDSIWYQAMGESYIATAFQTANAADPAAKLYINDYSIEGLNNAKSNSLFNLVKKLKDQGVPIHGVGFQSHLSTNFVPGDMQQNLQRFADLGVDVALTELDIENPSHNENSQAEKYSTVINSCVAVSRCVGVTIWGVCDKYSWIPDSTPLPFDSNYQPKPKVVGAIESALQ